jgi:Zn-dependent protease with chaperone function
MGEMVFPGIPSPLSAALLLVITAVPLIVGYMFDRRYKGPYTLADAGEQDKTRWSLILAFWKTLPFLLLGPSLPILLGRSGNTAGWVLWSALCSSVWILLFITAVSFERHDFTRYLQWYQSLDRRFKSHGKPHRWELFIRLTKVFMSEEQKRFFDEGYPPT